MFNPVEKILGRRVDLSKNRVNSKKIYTQEIAYDSMNYPHKQKVKMVSEGYFKRNDLTKEENLSKVPKTTIYGRDELVFVAGPSPAVVKNAANKYIENFNEKWARILKKEEKEERRKEK